MLSVHYEISGHYPDGDSARLKMGLPDAYFDYAKAGVMLNELVGGIGLQSDLFETPSEDTEAVERAARLMAVMDDINRKSRATVTMAREAGPGVYAMRRNHLSPAYTTSWEQLPKVY